MTRWVSNNNANAAGQPSVAMITMVDLAFPSGTLYLFDALGTLVWNGNTYLGLGDYGSLDAIDESTETIAKSITLTLSGVPNTLLTDAMTEDYQGQQVTIRIGLLDINAMTWFDNPEIIWQGRMDYMAVTMGNGKSEIQMHCEHRLNKEPLVARYTDQDQQIAFPGDKFFDLTWQIPLTLASWGAVTVQHPQNKPPSGRYGSSTYPTAPGGGGRHPGMNKP